MAKTERALDAKYFIEFFSEIPDEMWGTVNLGKKGGPRCALGHCCSVDVTSRHTSNLFRIIGWPGSINDGLVSGYQQATPKARVLAALEDAVARGL